MSYRTILVHLDMGRKSRERIDVALALAQIHDARLLGIYSTYVFEPQSFYLRAEFAENLQQIRTQRTKTGKELEAYFTEAARRLDVKAEWRGSDEHPNIVVPLHARHADLTIAGQTDPEDDQAYVAPRFIENLLLSAGRPVLVIPFIGAPVQIGQRPLIGWDCSHAATRAVHDALPFLTRAARSTLLTINALDDDEPMARLPGAEIATTLARHGANVETMSFDGIPRRRIGEILLSQAADRSADLIVVGAYGHMRVTELVLGGVTRTLLGSMTVPVLFSH
jgi:nucleotide-binding universal stress UspA family protein